MISEVITLRSFEETDVDEVIGLAEEAGLSHWSRRDYLAELARDDSYMRIATEHNELAGFIVGRFVPGSSGGNRLDAEIYNIGVQPRHRGSGVGKMLLSNFLDECENRLIEAVWLEVRKANSVAISFYQKAGFIEFAVRPKFYSRPPDDGIVMRLDLP